MHFADLCWTDVAFVHLRFTIWRDGTRVLSILTLDLYKGTFPNISHVLRSSARAIVSQDFCLNHYSDRNIVECARNRLQRYNQPFNLYNYVSIIRHRNFIIYWWFIIRDKLFIISVYIEYSKIAVVCNNCYRLSIIFTLFIPDYSLKYQFQKYQFQKVSRN